MPSAVRLRQDYSAEELRTDLPPVEGCQPEPSSSVAGCGSSGMDAGCGGEDRRHGSPTLRD